MDSILKKISQSVLFHNLSEEDLDCLLSDTGSRRKTFKKGEFVFLAGDTIDSLGIVLSGEVHIIQEDYWGNRNILTAVKEGEFFGEAFAATVDHKAQVDVYVTKDTEILFIDLRPIFSDEPLMRSWQQRFVANFIMLLATKNTVLTRKIRYISQRSMRRKVMTYLSDEANRVGKNSFTIPYNRQELADFFSVDRSALLAELSNMKKEGLIDYEKNRFTLLHTD